MNTILSVGEAIEQFLQKHGLADEILIQGILTDWERHIGAPVAAQTEAVWFERGVLYMRVPSPVWRNELMLARSRMKALLNEKIGKPLIEDLRIVS